MAQPVSKYDGNYITCYPGSNQQDDGKLQLEFNMARIVTRLSSKNFCTVKPSYEITQTTDLTSGKPCLQISEGQCSINGMDLIMTSVLTIPQPESTGTFYLKFKLARDSSNNVLGDFIYGVTTTFDGVYLTYDTEKPDPVSSDELYLGKVTWDGENFTDIEEDEDKYGRIWAEDVLCKINDPKHPDITRLTLQEWIYNVPDWYVSKEGDVEYGAIEFLPGRNTVTTPGIKLQAINETESLIEFNAPNAVDTNLKGSIESDMKGITFNIGNAYLTNKNDNYEITLYNGQSINIQSVNNVKLKGGSVVLQSFADDGYKFVVEPHQFTFTDSNSTELNYNVHITDQNTLDEVVGKSVWRYNLLDKTLSLLGTDTDSLNIFPTTIFETICRVKDILYLGIDDELPQTSLSRTQWYLKEDKESGKVISFTPSLIETINPTLSDSDNIILNLRNSDDSVHTKLFDNGTIELLNNTTGSKITLKDGNPTYDVNITKVVGSKQLDIDGNINVNGTITGTKVFNAVYNGFGEIFRKSKDEVIEYGDIVCVRNDGLVHKVACEEDIPFIIGVCSNTIGIQLGGKDIPENEQVEVEMVGQIWIKTDNLDIQPGCFIKALPNGKCDSTSNKQDKLGISITNVIDGKVRVIYNG